MASYNFESLAEFFGSQIKDPVVRQYPRISPYNTFAEASVELRNALSDCSEFCDKNSRSNILLQNYLKIMFVEGCNIKQLLAVNLLDIEGGSVQTHHLRMDLYPLYLASSLHDVWSFVSHSAASIMADSLDKRDPYYDHALNEFQAKICTGNAHIARMTGEVSCAWAKFYREQNEISSEYIVNTQQLQAG